MIAQLNTNYIKTRPWKIFPRLISYFLFEGRPLTTKGQFINPFLFKFLNFASKLPLQNNSKDPVFIIGTGRSGTTMMGVLLSLHPDIGFLNEPKALWHTIYDHEDVIGSYCRSNARFRLDENDASFHSISKANRLYRLYRIMSLSPRIVDKYPELVFRIPFVKKIFPRAKFIFLVRNGWDSCSSINIWSQRKGGINRGEIHDWWGVNNRKWKIMLHELIKPDPEYRECIDKIESYKTHTDMAVVEWITAMQEGLKQMEKYHTDILMVRYEEFIANPYDQLNRILKFCHLPFDNKLMNYIEKTMYTRQAHKRFKLPIELKMLFDKTMADLGYDS
jgi:hypothetical protein